MDSIARGVGGNYISNIFSNWIVRRTGEVALCLVVPNEILLRTELICECVSTEIGEDFSIADFLMAIYTNFTKNVIYKYEPKKIYNIMKQAPDYNESTRIITEEEVYIHYKFKRKLKEVHIKIDKKCMKKGELIIAELEELYGIVITFEKFFNNIWIHYISNYKDSNNENAYRNIYDLIS